MILRAKFRHFVPVLVAISLFLLTPNLPPAAGQSAGGQATTQVFIPLVFGLPPVHQGTLDNGGVVSGPDGIGIGAPAAALPLGRGGLSQPTRPSPCPRRRRLWASTCTSAPPRPPTSRRRARILPTWLWQSCSRSTRSKMWRLPTHIGASWKACTTPPRSCS